MANEKRRYTDEQGYYEIDVVLVKFDAAKSSANVANYYTDRSRRNHSQCSVVISVVANC